MGQHKQLKKFKHRDTKREKRGYHEARKNKRYIRYAEVEKWQSEKEKARY